MIGLVLVIDLKNGGRVILGLKSDGKLHSGAFDTTVERPFVHDGHFEVEKERLDTIFKAADDADPWSLEDEYVALDDIARFSVTFDSQGGSKEVLIMPPEEMAEQGKDLKACPGPLKTFVDLLWQENRW